MYTRKELAVVREYSTNAADAHIVAGKPIDQIIVSLPTMEDLNFRIRDFGNGLTETEIQEALEAAIANYRGEKVIKEDFEIVCKCFGVTDNEIIKAIRENNLKTIEQVTYYTKAGGGCGQCHPKIEALIERVRKEMEN
jgi:bacterioferritin-associated ferredoxin